MNISRVALMVDSSDAITAKRNLNQMQGAAQNAEATVTTMGRSMQTAARLASGAFAGLVATMGVHEVIGYADSWKQVNNQLKQVTDSEKELTSVRGNLIATAKSTNSELGTTVELYSELFRATRSLGTEQKTVADVTKTINNLFKAGGKAASETAGAVRQLAQGLASGTLRGDEFNSVAEGAPRILDALAESTGMARGELREFAADGKITAEILVKALSEYGEEAQRLADLTEETFGQKMVNARTNVTAFVGEANSLNSTINVLGDGIEGITENLDTLVTVGELAAVVIGGRLAGAAASSAAGMAVNAAAAVRGTATMNAYTGSLTRASAASNALTAASAGTRGALALIGGPVGLAFTAAAGLAYFVSQMESAEEVTARLKNELAGGTGSLAGAFDDLTEAQAKYSLLATTEKMQEAKDSLKDIARKIADTEQTIESLAGRASESYMAGLNKTLTRLNASYDDAKQNVSSLTAEIEELGNVVNGVGFGDIGDPFEVSRAAAPKVEPEKAPGAGQKELEFLREHNALIAAGNDVKSAAKQIDEMRLRAKLQDQDLTAGQIESYIELSRAIDGANEAAKKQESLANVQREIDLLASYNEMIKEGSSAKEAAIKIDEQRLALSLESQGATQAQIDQMLELQSAARAAGEESDSIAKLNSALESMRDQIDPMSELRKSLSSLQEIFEAGLIDESEFDKIKTGLEKVHAAGDDVKSVFIGIGESIDDMAGGTIKGLKTMQRVFDQGSKGYAQLEVAIQAVNAVQAINAVLNQAAGDPYTAIARMAVMAAAVASLGQSVGSLGGSFTDTAADRQENQGTGSVLGDWDAKSESIAKATDVTATATSELVGINRGMLSALQSLQQGIGGATTQIARGARGQEFDYGGQVKVNQNPLDGVSDLFDGPAQIGLLDELIDVVGGWLGGDSKVTDEGVRIIGGQLGEMIDDVMLQAYQETQSKKYAWSSTRTSTAFTDLEDDVTNQFSLVFEGIASSVSAGAEALGMSAADIDKAVKEFEIETQLISLKGLDADEQQAEIQAVFSSIFDGLAGEVVPYIDDFQRAGEGMGETLARVATNVQVTDEAIARLGFSADRLGGEQFAELSTALIDASGGLEQFLNGMSSFVDRFASDSHKFEIAQNDMARAFDQIGLVVPDTRDGLWELMQTLDANTASGREQIATLLRLSSAADDYYSQIEKQQREAMRAVEGIASALRNEINAIGSAAERLRGEMGGSETNRKSAMEELRDALITGDLSGTGQAAQAAANINANDFATADEYRREQARTLGLLNALEREGKQQIGTAEQSLNVLENIDGGIAGVTTAVEDLAAAIRHDRPQDMVTSSAPQSGTSQNKDLDRALTSNAELLQELRDMKAYIRQTTKNTGETRDQLNRWHREGMPEERELI